MNTKLFKIKKNGFMLGVISISTIALLGGNNLSVDAATKTYTLSADSETQSETFTLPTDFISLNSIKVNTGDVSYSIQGDKIKITTKNGEAVSNEPFYNDKLYLLPKFATTIYSDSNNFADTIDYETSDGYSGTLTMTGSPYVSYGSVTSGAQMTITTTKTSSTNNFPDTILYEKDYFNGVLNKYGPATQTLISGGNFTRTTKNGTLSLTNSTNNFPTTSVYDDGTYRGDIAQSSTATYGLLSGSYTPSDTKYVTGQSSSYYNSGGYVGTLTQYVASQTYVPAQTKTYSTTTSQSGSCYNDGSPNWGNCSPYPGDPSPRYVCDNGYCGTISKTDYNYYQSCYGSDCPSFSFTRTWTLSGTLTKPAYYQDNYAYQGYVTKPEVDTRVYGYTQNYSGEVVKYAKVTQALQSNTNSFPSTMEYQDQNGYSGTLDKSGSTKYDNGVYEQNYTGYIYSQTIDNRIYEWSQQYQGTVSQEDVDSRVWAAEYTGDLYKGGQDYNNEKYEYTVTIDYNTSKPSNCSYLGVTPITTTTVENYIPLCITLDDGSEKLYSFYYDFIVTGISNVQAGK